MPDKVLNLRIVTPDKTVFDGPVTAVGAMGSEGAFTALPGHVPFLTDLKPGALWYRQGEDTKEVVVSGGFIEILPERASVLADSAEYIDEIDVERAEASRKKYEEFLAKAKDAGAEATMHPADITNAELSLVKASVRLKYAKNKKKI